MAFVAAAVFEDTADLVKEGDFQTFEVMPQVAAEFADLEKFFIVSGENQFEEEVDYFENFRTAGEVSAFEVIDSDIVRIRPFRIKGNGSWRGRERR